MLFGQCPINIQTISITTFFTLLAMHQTTKYVPAGKAQPWTLYFCQDCNGYSRKWLLLKIDLYYFANLIQIQSNPIQSNEISSAKHRNAIQKSLGSGMTCSLETGAWIPNCILRWQIACKKFWCRFATRNRFNRFDIAKVHAFDTHFSAHHDAEVFLLIYTACKRLSRPTQTNTN